MQSIGSFIPTSSLFVQTFTQSGGKSVLKPTIVTSNLKMLTGSVLNLQLQIHYLCVSFTTGQCGATAGHAAASEIKRRVGAVSGSSHAFYTFVDHKLAFSSILKTWLPNLLTPTGK